MADKVSGGIEATSLARQTSAHPIGQKGQDTSIYSLVPSKYLNTATSPIISMEEIFFSFRLNSKLYCMDSNNFSKEATGADS
jgi:hypothetical protein